MHGSLFVCSEKAAQVELYIHRSATVVFIDAMGLAKRLSPGSFLPCCNFVNALNLKNA